MGEETLTDDQLTEMALHMYANWLETRNPLVSASDMRAMKRKVTRVPNEVSTARAHRLRELAKRYRKT